MKPLHWAFILVAIVLPVSIISRSLANSKFSVLKDEVRINNAIDTATKDAIDQIITANGGFLTAGFEYDNEFGNVIDVTPELAQESINTFFHTMAVNYNIPYKMSDTTTLSGERTDSYIKNYFASYIPAVVVIAYDGFYIYSIDETDTGYYGYKLSSKIPYAFDVGNCTIGYTLKDDIYLYLKDQKKSYSGKLNQYRSEEEFKAAYNEAFSNIGKDVESEIISLDDIDVLSSITNDMTVISYALSQVWDGISSDISEYLLPTNMNDIGSFMQDYRHVTDNESEQSTKNFHDKRREIITNIISECLRQEISEHNNYADIMGITYEFNLPSIDAEGWYNAINDISVMAFVQGIPMGTAKGTYFNSFALGGSQIVQSEYVYGNCYNGVPLYHRSNCSLIAGDNYTEIFINEDDAISRGYLACQLCHHQ